MIDSRLFGYIALAFVLMLLYQAWMKDYGRPNQPDQPRTAETEEKPVQDLPRTDFAPVPGQESPASPETPLNNVPESTTGGVTAADMKNWITVKTDVLRLRIDLKGGTIVSAELLAYPVDLEHPDNPVHIFTTTDGYYVAQSGLQAKDSAAPDHYALYEAAQRSYSLQDGDNKLQVPLTWHDSSGISVVKLFTFTRGQYDIQVSHRVENDSKQAWQGRQYRQLQRDYHKKHKSGLTQVRAYTGGVIYSPENHYEKIDFKEMAEKPLKRDIDNGWAAMIQHYFVTAWIPQRDQQNDYYSRGISEPNGQQRYVLGLIGPSRSIAAGKSAEFTSTLYVGPKIQRKLEQLAEGLELTVDYGYLTVIAKPLFWLLQQVHHFVGNWGWSIIIITLLIKAAFYKLAETSYRSMANMRRVQPKMAAIKERYGDDRQRQSQAMMELYKKEKINPLGGCLPMVIQIPVFLALYWVLLGSVELRQAPFIFWIHDLSIKDPYYVLPVIMGISMFIQQKLNPAPIDPIQAKVFMMLPFVFTIFFAFFPSGLVLYWVVNNITTIAQQWFITRRVLVEK